MNDFDTKVDRIGGKLVEALWRCIDGLNTDNLCLVVAQAYRLLDQQEAQEREEAAS